MHPPPTRTTSRRGRAFLLVVMLTMAIPAVFGWGAAEGQSGSSTSTSTSTTTKPGSSSTSSTKPASPSTSAVEHAADAGEPIQLRPAPVAVVDDPRSSPRLASVAVEGAAYTSAVSDYNRSIEDYKAATEVVPRTETAIQATITRQKTATDQFNARVVELGDLLTARNRVQGELNSAARRRDKGDTQLAKLRTDLREMAVNEYMAGGFGGSPEGILDLDNANQLGSRKVLITMVKRDRMVELQSVKAYRDDNDATANDRQAQLDEVAKRITATESARDQAVRDRDAALVDEKRARDEEAKAETAVQDKKTAVDDRRQAVADARITATVPDVGLPFVVVNAYFKAADRFGATCGIRWTALAGIGRTESYHGTFGGAEVDPDGNETKPIYGIPLDGSNGTANIGDTDGGALDQDSSTDRAMGPMQFIPGSWKTLGLDGNGDGKVEPQNYYDATMSAANLLCRQGPGLESDDGMRRAFRSYNNDGHYVETVLERAHGFDRYVFPAPDAATDPAKDVPGLTVPGVSTTVSTSTTSTTTPPRR